MTLASGRPVPKADLLFVLENALRLSNVSLVRDKRGYRLLPAPEAVGAGAVDAAAARRAGLWHHGHSAAAMSRRRRSIKLLDSFATQARMRARRSAAQHRDRARAAARNGATRSRPC